MLNHLAAHRQTRWWQREAGGLLFAEIAGGAIRVVEATGPGSGDRRSRFSFGMSLARQQSLIDERFDKGLDYVGEWHSHPEPVPSPSGRDHRTMASRVGFSTHGYNGLLFAIIGTAPLPGGLTLLLHDGERAHRLTDAPSLSPRRACDLDETRGVET